MSIRRLFSCLYSPRYLLLTNTASGIVCMSAGDCIQQTIEKYVKREEEWSFKRNLQMSAGGLYFGLFGHFWYRFLDKRFPSGQKRALLWKLCCEAGMGPPLVASMFVLVSRLKALSLADTFDQLRAKLPLIVAVEWFVYLPLQTLNFLFISARFRYTFVACISVAYDALLSCLVHRNALLENVY